MNTVIRVQHSRENPYLVLSKQVLQSNLSLEAKGLWATIMSKKDDWKIIPKLLAQETGIGRDKLYKILNELKKAGLLIYRQTKEFLNGIWHFGLSEYIVFETPQATEECEKFKKSLPYPDFSYTENQEALINKEEEEEALEKDDFSFDEKESSSSPPPLIKAPEKSEKEKKLCENAQKALKKKEIRIPTIQLLLMIRRYGSYVFKQAFYATMDDYTHGKKVKSFYAVLVHKLAAFSMLDKEEAQ